MNHRKIFYQAVIPSMLAFALSGIYSVADGFFVGNSLGDNALAAINIAYPLTAFIQAAGTGIGMGGAVMFAIHNGSGDYSRSRKFFGISLLLLALSGFLFTLFFLGNGERILRMFGAEGDILRLGAEYFRYIAFGTLFQVMATGIVPFIRNMGSPVTAMFAMTGGFLTNILLDYILVWVLPYGMTGAAVATVIGQAVTLAVCLIFLMRKRELPSLSFDKETLHMAGKVLFVAISPFGLTFSPNITLILVNKSAVYYGGNTAVACYASISYISSVVLLLLQGVSDGSQPLISLCYGKKRNPAGGILSEYGLSLCPCRIRRLYAGHLFQPGACRRFVRGLPRGNGKCRPYLSCFYRGLSVCWHLPDYHLLFLRNGEKPACLYPYLWRTSVPAAFSHCISAAVGH